MNAYAVVSVDRKGGRKRRTTWAIDLSDARYGIRRLGEHVISIRSAKRREITTLGITRAERTSLFDQLAMQLDAQVPFDLALTSLIKDLPSEKGKALLAHILDHVGRTGEIASAFGLFPQCFPPHYLAMIEVGHRTGRLAETFDTLSRHEAESSELGSLARKAMIYPMLAGGIMVAVAIFLIGFVMPLFQRVFTELDIEIPPLTRFYFGISSAVTSCPWGWAIGLFLLLASAVLIRRTRQWKRSLDLASVRIPGLAGLIETLALARIASALEALQRSGVSIQEALLVLNQAAGNVYFDDALEQVRQSMHRGQALADAMEETQRFPRMATLTLRVGENSNRLAEALGKLKEYHSRKAKQRTQEAIQLLEPVLTVALGLFVASVALSLFYPLVTLAMNIKR